MKLILILTVLLIMTACTSVQMNQNAIKQACKAGINEYDDGTTSFSCYPKGTKHDSAKVQKDQ